MISYGTPGSSVFSIIHISKFDPSSISATKHFSDPISLADAVSRAGSIWTRALVDNVALVQSFSDFYNESLVDTLLLADASLRSVDRPAAGSSIMTISDSLVYTGTAGGSVGGPVDNPEGIFDSAADEGMVLYVPSSGHVDLAQANNVLTAGAIGLAFADTVITATGDYMPEGQITKADWTSVTGSVTLTPGAVYFLSISTAGGLTATPPSAAGETVVRIGRALSTTTLDIEISQPILL